MSSLAAVSPQPVLLSEPGQLCPWALTWHLEGSGYAQPSGGPWSLSSETQLDVYLHCQVFLGSPLQSSPLLGVGALEREQSLGCQELLLCRPCESSTLVPVAAPCFLAELILSEEQENRRKGCKLCKPC